MTDHEMIVIILLVLVMMAFIAVLGHVRQL